MMLDSSAALPGNQAEAQPWEHKDEQNLSCLERDGTSLNLTYSFRFKESENVNQTH